MNWKARHEGSPRAVEGLSLNEIVQGLLDGRWETTDEVMGPQDAHWLAIENHPQLAELAMDIEPPPRKPEEDETRLDMNALIDVCLVLLVFFILTTSYAAIQKMLEMPGLSAENVGVPKVTKEKVEQTMIKVEIRMEKGADKDVPVIKVEGEKVDRAGLVLALTRLKKASNKTQLLLDYSPDVPYGVVIAVQDAAQGAKIEAVHILVPKDELTAK